MRIEGPEELIRSRLQFIYPANLLATDLYSASFSSFVSMPLQTDLSVGRAPVNNAQQADTFVDKTLAYERLGTVGWRSPNPN